MTRYEDVKKNEKLLIALTSLTIAESEELLAVWERVWDEQVATNQTEGRDRERGFGGGRKPVLEKDEDKLLFILCYFKTCPLQIVPGHMFGMSQSQANERIHRPDGILKTALAEMGHLPERDPEKLAETLAEDGESNLITDGADRKIQRPKDNEKQKEYYSGKKKTHTVKNNVVAGAEDRKVKYLSGTCEGKKSDKKLCDEENLTFPAEVTLYKDKGFQGYEPEGTETRQPKKKPKGGELSIDEEVENAVISGIRIVVEHVISGIKRCRIVKDVFRNTKSNFNDLVTEIACGLHNLRTSYR
ncbi:transposase family protein [Desulfococcaceae bacterium HSG8]|nr:transposase family protein [Desulfococcaceae bacterium HSG8]